MSFSSVQQRINEALREVEFANKSGSHLNCIRLSSNNLRSKHTEEMISRCLEYIENGVDFLTEAKFTHNRGRCDILLPSLFEIDEILHSETDEMFEKKKLKYPSVFKINKIRV